MSSEDLSLRILVDIREQTQATHLHVDQLEQRLERVDQKLDRVEQRLDDRIDTLETALGRRIVESEIRTATALNGLAGTLQSVHDMLRDRFELRDRVARCERDIDQLRHRTG
jgi:uncharacterized protein YhaN